MWKCIAKLRFIPVVNLFYLCCCFNIYSIKKRKNEVSILYNATFNIQFKKFSELQAKSLHDTFLWQLIFLQISLAVDSE